MDSTRGPQPTAIPRPAVPWFLRSRGRLLVTLLAVLVVPFTIFNFAVVKRVRGAIAERERAKNQAVAGLAADAVGAHFEGLVVYIEGFAARPAFRTALELENSADVQDLLREFVEKSRNLGRAFVSDPQGYERYDWPNDPTVIGQSFAHRDWYKGVVAANTTYVSEIYVRAAAPKCEVVSLAVPIRGTKGLLGYLVAQYTIESLTTRLQQLMPLGSGVLTVFDQNARPALKRVDAAPDPAEPGDRGVLEEMFSKPNDTRNAKDPISGEPSLLSSALVPSIDWHVLARVPSEDLDKAALSLEFSLLLAAGTCLLGMLVLGFIWLNVVRRHHFALLDLQRQKDLLSGMVLHDLRNPLAITMGSLDLARAHEEDLDPGIRDDLTRAARSARRARELLNTLLDIMRMEEGVLALKLERTDLAALVRGKVDEYQPLARTTSVALSAVLPERGIEASLDVGLIGRVLDNLVTNAVKHTPPGGRIEVRLDPEDGGRRIALSVSDTGEGIPADAMPLLFQKFTPIVGQQMTRPHDAGLGLVFCRMTVERHGGTIEARSERGKGSVFRVLLPLAAA